MTCRASSRNGATIPQVSASGSSVSGTSRPIVSRMKSARAAQRAATAGNRAASSARKVSVRDHIAVLHPGRAKDRMRRDHVALHRHARAQAAAIDPSAIGEDIHSSSPIRWPGFSSTAEGIGGQAAPASAPRPRRPPPLAASSRTSPTWPACRERRNPPDSARRHPADRQASVPATPPGRCSIPNAQTLKEIGLPRPQDLARRPAQPLRRPRPGGKGQVAATAAARRCRAACDSLEIRHPLAEAQATIRRSADAAMWLANSSRAISAASTTERAGRAPGCIISAVAFRPVERLQRGKSRPSRRPAGPAPYVRIRRHLVRLEPLPADRADLAPAGRISASHSIQPPRRPGAARAATASRNAPPHTSPAATSGETCV